MKKKNNNLLKKLKKRKKEKKLSQKTIEYRIKKKSKKPIKEETKVKQASEFEKNELFDVNKIAALIDKSKEDYGETNKKTEQNYTISR